MYNTFFSKTILFQLDTKTKNRYHSYLNEYLIFTTSKPI